MRLLPRKAEHLVLLGPFDWQVGEARNPHAVGEPAIDGRFDQIRREESKRDCHVDLSRAAVFSICDAVGTRCWIGDQFIKPTAAAGNRRDQSRARPRTYRQHIWWHLLWQRLSACIRAIVANPSLAKIRW
jgi:hypothetical protein